MIHEKTHEFLTLGHIEQIYSHLIASGWVHFVCPRDEIPLE